MPRWRLPLLSVVSNYSRDPRPHHIPCLASSSQTKHVSIMNSTSSEKIVEYFSHKTINFIIGQSTHQYIHRFHDMINKNAVSVRSNLGGGNFGMLRLALSLAAYAVLSPSAFTSPHPTQAWRLSSLTSLPAPKSPTSPVCYLSRRQSTSALTY